MFMTARRSFGIPSTSMRPLAILLTLAALFDQTRLMYSGTNGELLTDIEQAVARYGAQGIADGAH